MCVLASFILVKVFIFWHVLPVYYVGDQGVKRTFEPSQCPRTVPLSSSRCISRGNKCQLMATSLLREVTEPAVFVPEVAKQHVIFARAIAFGVLVSARASF